MHVRTHARAIIANGIFSFIAHELILAFLKMVSNFWLFFNFKRTIMSGGRLQQVNSKVTRYTWLCTQDYVKAFMI